MELEVTCEGKVDCINRVKIGVTKARALRTSARPVLCLDCNKIYGGMTSKAIDTIDPTPKDEPNREII